MVYDNAGESSGIQREKLHYLQTFTTLGDIDKHTRSRACPNRDFGVIDLLQR